jgi:hypothetical protein
MQERHMLYHGSIGWLAGLGGIALALIACGAPSVTPIAAQPTTLQPATPVVPTQTAIPPTEAPTRLPTATPEPTCVNAWMEAYRDGSPSVEAQIQQSLAAEKISANVHSSLYGETDGCGTFHAASLDIEVTAQVKRISERAELEALATRIDAVIQQAHAQTKIAPNLGRHQIIFVANDTTCRWDAEQRACQP